MEKSLDRSGSSSLHASNYLSNIHFIVLVGYGILFEEIITQTAKRFGFKKSALQLVNHLPEPTEIGLIAAWEDANCVGIFVANTKALEPEVNKWLLNNSSLREKVFRNENVPPLADLEENFNRLFKGFELDTERFIQQVDIALMKVA